MLYEIVFGIGILALLAALAYGFRQYRSRNRANDPVTDQATRAIYREPEAAYERDRERLKDETHPS